MAGDLTQTTKGECRGLRKYMPSDVPKTRILPSHLSIFAERLERVKSNGLGEDEDPGGLLGEEA